MEIYESMMGRRMRGAAGLFRAAVGILLLGFCVAQSIHPQTACPASAPLQNLTQPDYQNPAEQTGGGFLSAFLHSFLHTVQPNPFPKDLILTIANDTSQLWSNQALIKKILLYDVGFLVCAAIGIIYIVLIPIVGIFFLCCRLCGNCGGKMYQPQTSSTHCSRRVLYLSLFVVTAVILAGNICMFKSNEALKQGVDRSTVGFNNSIENIRTYLTAVPQEVQYLLNESNNTVQAVLGNLDAIGPQLGRQIQNRFGETYNPALQSLVLMKQETVNISEQLNKLNMTLANLQSSMDIVQADVTAVKNDIHRTLSKPDCIGCDSLTPQLQTLTLGSSIQFASLSELESALGEVNEANLQSKIQEVRRQFNDIPQTVTNNTKVVVQNSKPVLNDVENMIFQMKNKTAGISGLLAPVVSMLGQAQELITRFISQAEIVEHIRWAVCVALSCVIFLVIVCNFLGMLLGPLGLSPKTDPTKRSSTADCGGTLFMMGAGCSFLFSWLFMIVVVILFVLGGNTYSLLCQPWKSGELLKFIDTSGLTTRLGMEEKLGTNNFSIYNIYRDCENNEPLWSTFHLHDRINLSSMLNVSQYKDDIEQQFENMHIALSSLTFLSPDVKNQLRSFATRMSSIDFNTVIQQVNNISNINLNTTADLLDVTATNLNGATKTELQNEANALRAIQADIETIIIPQLEELNSTIEALLSTATKINGTVGEVLSNVRAAQDFFNTNMTQITRTESRKFLDCQLGYLSARADWASQMITQDVGRCGPVAGAVDSAETIVCYNLVQSLNAYWFSLGWCLLFLIPSIILSIKLAKHYRRMKYSDVFDDHIVMTHIPRAQMKTF